MSDFWDSVAKTTADLSMTEVGAYRLLLDHYINLGGALQASEEQLLRVCRAIAKQEQVAARSVLLRFFVQRDGLWHHDGADALIAKRQRLSAIRAEIGRRGGSNNQAIGQAIATQAIAKQKLPLSSSSLRKKKEARGRPGLSEPPGPPAAQGPGWEAEHPKWAKVRAAFREMHGSDDVWQRTFATCRPNGSDTTLICRSTFDRERLEAQFAAQLERTFGEPVTFKVEGQKPKENRP